MRPGQLTPENTYFRCYKEIGKAKASMRPGQLTPENEVFRYRFYNSYESFNEAGAINPGKLVVAVDDDQVAVRFNEAGAINPGKRSLASSRLRRRERLQ